MSTPQSSSKNLKILDNSKISFNLSLTFKDLIQDLSSCSK